MSRNKAAKTSMPQISAVTSQITAKRIQSRISIPQMRYSRIGNVKFYRLFPNAQKRSDGHNDWREPARQYSIKASPQLMRMTVNSGTSLKRRCQYQAAVMKTLEPSSSKIGSKIRGQK